MLQVTDARPETVLVKTKVLEKILELSESILQGDYSRRVVVDFNDDAITRIVDNLNKFCDKVQLDPSSLVYSQEETVSTFIEVISSFANLDFKKKLPISESGTIMDAIATGINVLGDELEHSTASKHELEIERNRLNEAQAIAKIGSWELVIPSLQLKWSNEAYRIFELERMPDENLYDAYLKKIHPDDVSMIETLLKEAGEKGERFVFEYRIINKNRSIHFILCNGEVVRDQRAKTASFKGTIQDITDRKQVEEALNKAKEYAEDANKAKSMFLANMSHEIRTPLNGILGLTEVMLGEEVSDEHRHYLEIIGNSGKNLSKLINDILDLSKVESGKLKLENIPFNLNEIVSFSINSYKLQIERKGLTLTYHFDESIPKIVTGDPTRISQVLNNLIGNAIKFTNEGIIDITFSLKETKSDEVVIQGIVKDTGIGIPKEIQDTIFQSFTQADETVTRKYGGTGLGLSIVKSILHQMHGDIRLQSPADSIRKIGSAFIFSLTVSLPANPVNQTSPGIIRQKLTFKRPLHILIVDDNHTNLLVARKMVQRFGATVTAVDSGVKALDLAKAHDYDIVLMDIQMPELDGHQTTIELRKLNFSKPIIALSAVAYREDVQNSIKSGMNDHLQKPYTEESLFQIIAKYIE